MSWIDAVRAEHRRLRWYLLVLLIFLPFAAQAEDRPAEQEIWLVTYGPGEIYWQRFGHNALWVRDTKRGLDHTFNFGFFDFAQENFFLRFLQGRMLYFSAAQPARKEFVQYQAENRSIRLQRLELDSQQIELLIDYLVNEVAPQNRDYLYHYYRNNCSTRVRDAIDLALGGSLEASTRDLPASGHWRDHTRRLTAGDFWLYLGLQISLGSPVDREISLWEEMFIPSELAGAAAQTMNADGTALVSEDSLLLESGWPEPPAVPEAVWYRYLAASLFIVLLAWAAGRRLPAGLLARAWLILAGLMGAALLFLWLATDHDVARLNMNLLVLNPLWLIFALWKRTAGLALPFIGLVSSVALVMPWLPPGQYTADVLAAFLPLNLAAAYALRPRV
jgi:hypothetical protein